MNNFKMVRTRIILSGLFFAYISCGTIQAQQRIVLGLHVDPVISWFSSDVAVTQNSGARPGFNFGLTFNKYFTSNYAFSTGISLQNAGGRLISNTSQPTILQLSKPTTVASGESVIYKIQYLSVPLGLKLQANRIGYITFFSDIGIDPKIVVAGKVDIPYLSISNERAINELNVFNLSYHIMAGMEYQLTGNNSFIIGFGFEKALFDITRDNGDQPSNVVLQKLLSFRLGMTF